jgi:mono/diheme cytochrome c family protein
VSALLVILFFVILGLAVVLIAMRSGSRGPLLDPQKRGGRRAVTAMLVLAVVLFAVTVPITVALDNSDNDAKAGALDLSGHEREGRQLFNENCTQCHTLQASNSVQLVGPDLDELRPPKELILDAIEKGRARGQGQMPALLVTGPEADAVAAYVAKVAGR